MYELEKVMSKFHERSKIRIKYDESLRAFAKTFANKLYERNLALEDNDFSFAKQCVCFACNIEKYYSKRTMHIISICFDEVFEGFEVKDYIKRIRKIENALQ